MAVSEESRTQKTISKYLPNYAPELIHKITHLVENNQLAEVIQARYPCAHSVYNDQALREYASEIKSKYLKKSSPLSKVIYDNKIHVMHNALGLHSYVGRVQGGKVKTKNEIRVSSVFRKTPEEFLKMIVVHELAHLKEKDHNKAFYRLCEHMLPNYHQLEFDMRVYLIQLELGSPLY